MLKYGVLSAFCLLVLLGFVFLLVGPPTFYWERRPVSACPLINEKDIALSSGIVFPSTTIIETAEGTKVYDEDGRDITNCGCCDVWYGRQ